MDIPTRIQRKGTKGYRHPPNTKYVGRPGEWGNPFVIKRMFDKWLIIDTLDGGYTIHSEYCSRNFAIGVSVELYRSYLKGHWLSVVELFGYNHLSCWCPLDQPCHVDVIIERIRVAHTAKRQFDIDTF